MSADGADDVQTPSSSKSPSVSLKRKSCPAKVECKKAKWELGTPLSASFASCSRLHRLTPNQRQQLKQRRLEFKTSTLETPEKADKKESSTLSSVQKELELPELIRKAEEELNARAAHERKVAELKESIEIWQRGLNRVLADLQNKLPTRPNKREILQQLHVPSDILDYVEDPDD